jgi:hypothetical protein
VVRVNRGVMRKCNEKGKNDLAKGVLGKKKELEKTNKTK